MCSSDLIAARPFGNSLRQMLANVAAAAKGSDAASEHPLLVERPEERVLAIIINADRGLAGAFSTNINRGAQKFLTEEKAGKTVEIEAVGKKARDYFRRRGFTISGEMMNVTKAPKYADAAALGRKVVERYANGEVDSVYLIYNEFKSVISQKLDILQVLPVPLPAEQSSVDYIFEQDRKSTRLNSSH